LRGIGPLLRPGRPDASKKYAVPLSSLDRKSCCKRNIIERCVSSLKWFRRVATRYEKLAIHYLGIMNLAIIFRLQ
jgi:hypothetical protein